ncbi:FAD-dependent monooxygenase [Amycolatopsis sp. NPDC048633]|uniref:FAD-dependent monooxygenase n=1 Tax=Amycolatopsis sp. NPDC048633 TaxID=3157095 RepID=UPI003401B9F1
MTSRHIAVVGGGPGGLYVARLIKRAKPEWRVTVYEHNAAADTFGFGVGLTETTLRALAAADPESAETIQAAGHRGGRMDMLVGDAFRMAGSGADIAIGRATLLGLLRAHAEDAGVRIVMRHAELTDVDADVVVAADGVRSRIRDKLGVELAAEVRVDDVRYLWCGARFALPAATFTAATTDYGTFVAHSYPYDDEHSTFLIETDEATWRAAGFDREVATGESDEESLDFLSAAFAQVLGGSRLLGNATRWQQFATVRAGRWSHGNVVLLGDAAHTAHYSIGSGTKLALEDAIALADAVTGIPDLAEAFAEYERRRRPRVERLQAIAERSQQWWKDFPRRIGLPAAVLVTSFMTRSGNVSVEQFASSRPEAVIAAAVGLGIDVTPADAADPERLAAAVLGAPLPAAGTSALPRRLVETADRVGWCAENGVSVALFHLPLTVTAQVALEAIKELVADGADGAWLTGPDTPAAVHARLGLAERVRLELAVPVGIDLPRALRSVAVGAVLSGRTDLVHLT